MTQTFPPARHRQALVVRLCEAALEPDGWQAVVRGFGAETEQTVAVRFRSAGAVRVAERPAKADETELFAIEGLGSWNLTSAVGAGDLGAGDVNASLEILRRALSLALRLGEGLPLDTAELEAVLDPLPYAAILLDGRAGLLFANAAGEDLLASRKLFRPGRIGERLQPTRRRADEKLDAAATRILQEGDAGTSWIIPGLDGGRLVIRLRPVGPATPPRTDAPVARLLMTLRTVGPARSLRPQGPERDEPEGR